jgi:hypothetical protein
LTIPDVSQPEFSNQIASPDSLSLSTRALKTSRGLVFEDHVSPDEHISCQPDSRSMAQRNPIGSHKSQESQSRTTAVSLGLPSSANYVAHIQGKLDQQSTPEPSAMTSTAVSLDRGPAADVDLMISPAIVVSLPHMASKFKLTRLIRREHTVSHHSANRQKRFFHTKSSV